MTNDTFDRNAVTALTVNHDGRVLSFKGREAWALYTLIQRGERGATPIDAVGPRWSQYVMKIRRAGLDVETIRETHGGPYSGHHGRYVLRSRVSIMKVARAGEARHAA